MTATQSDRDKPPTSPIVATETPDAFERVAGLIRGRTVLKVYVLLTQIVNDDDTHGVCGVFLTREGAEREVEESKKRQGSKCRMRYEIEEYEVYP